MRKLDMYGYGALLTGLLTFFVLDLRIPGLFLQGMALGFFGKSVIEQAKDMRSKKQRTKYVRKMINSECSDQTKMNMLGLNSMAELRRLERTFKEDK